MIQKKYLSYRLHCCCTKKCLAEGLKVSSTPYVESKNMRPYQRHQSSLYFSQLHKIRRLRNFKALMHLDIADIPVGPFVVHKKEYFPCTANTLHWLRVPPLILACHPQKTSAKVSGVPAIFGD
jgi:hypothetical protein